MKLDKTSIQHLFFFLSFFFFISINSGVYQALNDLTISKNVCLSFSRPLSGSVLVVGCDNGLFVWTVDPSSPAVRCVLCIT